MGAVQPRFQVCEDEMDDWQILLSDLRIAAFRDGKVFVAALAEPGVAAPVVGDERRARHNGTLDEAAERLRASNGPCLSGCNTQPLGLVFGHAHGRSPAWRSSAPTIAPRISATFSRRRGLRRLLGEDSLERRVHLPPLSGGGRAVPLR